MRKLSRQGTGGGVIFDVDGTLLDTNYLHVAAWWDAFRERGHDIRCADVHRALGMGSSDLVERVLGRPDTTVIEAHGRYFAPKSKDCNLSTRCRASTHSSSSSARSRWWSPTATSTAMDGCESNDVDSGWPLDRCAEVVSQY
jgi:hypothetical protein